VVKGKRDHQRIAMGVDYWYFEAVLHSLPLPEQQFCRIFLCHGFRFQ